MSIDELKEKIKNVFIEIGPKIHTKTSKFSTATIFSKLEKIAYDIKNYIPYYTGNDEFLVDFCIREEEEKEDSKFKKIPLACECEWNLDFKSIQYDFEKLLVLNADLKLMIFNSADKNKAEKDMKKLCSIISEFDSKSCGKFIFFSFVDKEASEQIGYFLFGEYDENSESKLKSCILES